MLGWLLSWAVTLVGWLLWLSLVVLRWILTPIPLAVLAAALAYGYFKFTNNFDFWKARGVPGPTPRFPWGSDFGLVFAKALHDFDDWLYNTQGGKKYCGFFMFNKPMLYTGDPDLIRTITIKDFDCFTDRKEGGSKGEMLTSLNGQKWKTARSAMSPTFSASKLKVMHQLTLDNAKNLTHYAQEEMKSNGGVVELKALFAKFTMDNISSCAFGVQGKSFTDPKDAFGEKAKLMSQPSSFVKALMIARVYLPSSIGNLLPNPSVECYKFFTKLTQQNIKHRETVDTPPRDFLQLLLETKDKDGKRALTDSSIIAQCIIFFLAGYDNVANALSFAAHSLATSPECQRRAQEEIDAVLERHGGQLTYEALMEMTYLDRVLSETLRLFPAVARMERCAVRDYTIPDTNIHLPKGTTVQMSIYAMQRDPEHYPDPLRFDPDRFLPEEKEKRHPATWVPFGNGPRNCIGLRFALFETKVALVSVLKDLTLLPTETTPPPPMPLEKKSLSIVPQGNIMSLRVVLREKSK